MDKPNTNGLINITNSQTTCVFNSSLNSGPAASSNLLVTGFLSVKLSLVGLTTASNDNLDISPTLY